ncbi:MAG: porin family protein [Prevotella sp.]|nr:PorT family protein [Prevotella sp.]MCI7361245.1 PorT family protein [Prevotella sp.]MDD6592506.1 porin family protein [Prevotella sp.]MDD6671603.1 porin family protein [Prevotella sp.]MDY3898494.1 porin family protein [Prevotella sp.]
MRNFIISAILSIVPVAMTAQIGEHRNDLAIGFNGGLNMSSVSFTPKVSQAKLNGITGGLSVRYVCEKYFSTVCSLYGEINYSQMGWKEDIVDVNDMPVINTATGLPEEYSRTVNYIQVPLMAHLAWGREQKGFAFFVNLGPQFGIYMSESTKTNFDFSDRNAADRVNPVCAQDTMAVENKFDYGIAAGAGIEFSHPKVGHFLLEGRYYYGLGNIYGDSKRDYFGSSNFGTITVKLAYLFDIVRTRRQ